MGLQRVTGDYKGFTVGYKGLQGMAKGDRVYKKLQLVTT